MHVTGRRGSVLVGSEKWNPNPVTESLDVSDDRGGTILLSESDLSWLLTGASFTSSSAKGLGIVRLSEAFGKCSSVTSCCCKER